MRGPGRGIADGVSEARRLTAGDPSFTVPSQPSSLEVVRTYLLLGVKHILSGIDHLMFVLALLLLVKGTRRIIVTVTAFTLAHSLTLAGATLGFVHTPDAGHGGTHPLSRSRLGPNLRGVFDAVRVTPALFSVLIATL